MRFSTVSADTFFRVVFEKEKGEKKVPALSEPLVKALLLTHLKQLFGVTGSLEVQFDVLKAQEIAETASPGGIVSFGEAYLRVPPAVASKLWGALGTVARMDGVKVRARVVKATSHLVGLTDA